MATETDSTPTGSAAVLDGLGAIVNRGSLGEIVKHIRTIEDMVGPGKGQEKETLVLNKLTRTATEKVPALVNDPDFKTLLASLVKLTVRQMNKNGELPAHTEKK